MGTANIGTINTQRFDVDLPPYDAEVEYLHVVGTATESPWIDTEVQVLENDEISMKIIAPSTAAKFRVGSVLFSDFFTTSLHGGGIGIGRFSGLPVRAYFLGKYETATVSNYNKGLVSYRLNQHMLDVEVDGTTTSYSLVNISEYVENRGTLGLFGCSQRTTHPIYDFGCVQFSIIRNGIAIRDMIPVRFTNELNQSEGAMYDRVSKQLFRNQGEGAFSWVE